MVDLRQQVLDDESVPEAVRNALLKGYALDEIRLDAHGRWWHMGQPIQHPRVSDLFSRSVGRTEGGTYVLEIWRFTYPIVVDATPYFVSSVALDDLSEPRIRLNDGSEERLREPIWLEGDDRLLTTVKEGRFQARFLRTAYHELLRSLDEDADGWFLSNTGIRIATSPDVSTQP